MRSSILLVLLLTSIQLALASDSSKVMESLQSVVMIRAYNKNGSLGTGSGVVVAHNKVLTNCHIFRSTKQPWIARGEDSFAIASVQADRWHDLCLITAVDLPFKAPPLGKGFDLKRGLEVVAIGHSNGTPAPLISEGNIKSTYTFDDGKIIRSSAIFLMGASGSGIFDLDGNLLGINTFKTPGRPAYYYSLPIEWLANLEKQPIETEFPIDGKAFWEEDDDKKPFFMQMALPEINQDWTKLVEVSQKWIEASPNNTDAWFELGTAKENLNKITEAKNAYHQALKFDANNTDALFRLGSIAINNNDKAEINEVKSAIGLVDKDMAEEYGRMIECGSQC